MKVKRILTRIGSLFFILLILIAFVSTALSQSMVIMAVKTDGDLPDSPDNRLWDLPSATTIPLAPQVVTTPRLYEHSIKEISVKALHNGTEIAFLLEWADETKDVMVDMDKFTDAVALQFPSSKAQGKPHFAMGDNDNYVNIWHWKAVWQEKNSNRRIYATVDDFFGGVLAENPVSIQKTPIESIMASGYGSVTSMKPVDSAIRGSGEHHGKVWKVIFTRGLQNNHAYEANFREGELTPVAFAAWDGHNGELGGKKSVSTWYYVGLESAKKNTVYLYPVLAFLGALALEFALIKKIRKRKER